MRQKLEGSFRGTKIRNTQSGIRGEYADYLVKLKRYREALAEYEAVLQRSPPKPDRFEKRVRQLRRALGIR